MFGLPPFYYLAGLLALIPALIWLIFIFRKNRNRWVQLLIFGGGIVAVIPIFILQIIFFKYPNLDFITHLQNLIKDPNLQFIVLFLWVGITEELIKQWILRTADSRFLIVQTINDSISFSLIAALGFSFAENIFYFYQIGTSLGLQTLFVAYFFRSIFTTCAHLVFSGFFGYYFGIAKFSITIFEQSEQRGRKFYFYKILSRWLNMSRIQAYKEATILKGLLIAILMHSFYNYTLQFNFIPVAAIFILISYYILTRLLKHRAGQLILVQDNTQNQSTMAKTDEDVVVELLGMWFNQSRYVDVIHICDRLLKRDPGNRVVELFKAKALDKIDPNNPYQKILQKLFPNKKPTQLLPNLKQQTINQTSNSKVKKQPDEESK